MRTDPAPRDDDRCSGCGKRLDRKTMRRYAGVQADQDPWCSAACARRFHGCELVKLDNRGRLVDGEETAA